MRVEPEDQEIIEDASDLETPDRNDGADASAPPPDEPYDPDAPPA